jgi:hypothetical protein
MSDKELLQDPTNRIVSVFDEFDAAESARQDLLKHGYEETEIRVLHGQEAASDVDTSPKWFADTDDDIKMYQRELEAGHTVISVPVENKDGREQLHSLLRQHGARLVTHFGQWVTAVMR